MANLWTAGLFQDLPSALAVLEDKKPADSEESDSLADLMTPPIKPCQVDLVKKLLFISPPAVVMAQTLTASRKAAAEQAEAKKKKPSSLQRQFGSDNLNPDGFVDDVEEEASVAKASAAKKPKRVQVQAPDTQEGVRKAKAPFKRPVTAATILSHEGFNLPPELHPTGPRGAYSFTVRSPSGSVCEVHLRKKCHFIKKSMGLRVGRGDLCSPHISWGRFGGCPQKTWEFLKPLLSWDGSDDEAEWSHINGVTDEVL